MSGSVPVLRYARSGHRERALDEEQRRLARFGDPLTLRRLRVIGGAAVSPVVIALGVAVGSHLLPAGSLLVDRPSADSPAARPIVAAPWRPAPPVDATVTTTPSPTIVGDDGTTIDTLRSSESLSSALARHKVSADDVSAALRALRGSFPAGALRPGIRFALRRSDEHLLGLVVHTENAEGAPRTVTLRLAPAAPDTMPSATSASGPASGMATPGRPAPRFEVQVDDAPVELVVEGLAGDVETTLAAGIVAAGGDVALVDRFVDAFSGDVDFHRMSLVGDEFRVLVEKRYALVGDERRFLGYGKVVAAEYNGGGRVHRSFAYVSADGHVAGIFDEEGASRRRVLLKNPLDVAAVLPDPGVHGGAPPPNGRNYDAPLGTPVWSTGDGVVVDARFGRVEGNMVVVDHGDGWTTTYQHLARVADGIRPGVRVAQKQVLGSVGSTGVSARPHLHYAVRKDGVGVDVNSVPSPAAGGIPAAYRPSFAAFIGPLLAQLRALARA